LRRVDSKVISIDGTKIEANASAWANRSRRQLADEILAGRTPGRRGGRALR
jgi:hypothetical protein